MWRARAESVDNAPMACREMLISAQIWSLGRGRGIRPRRVSPPDRSGECWFSPRVCRVVWPPWAESPWHSRPKSDAPTTIVCGEHRPRRENFCSRPTWRRHRWRENSSARTTQFHYRLRQWHCPCWCSPRDSVAGSMDWLDGDVWPVAWDSATMFSTHFVY